LLIPRRECVYRYSYDADGQLVEETALDETGHAVWVFHYTTRDAGYFRDEEGGLPRPHSRAGASFVAFHRSAEGFDLEARYTDAAGAPRRDGNGAYGLRWQRDARGLSLRETRLDAEGRPFPFSTGVAGSIRTYDDRGKLTRVTFVTPD